MYKLKVKFRQNNATQDAKDLPIDKVESVHCISDSDDLETVCGFINTFSDKVWFVPDLLDAIESGEYVSENDVITVERY